MHGEQLTPVLSHLTECVKALSQSVHHEKIHARHCKKMLDHALRLKHIIEQLIYIPGADRKSIAIQASGLEMPIAYHHAIGSRFFVDIVGVLRYSSSLSEAASVPKSSRAEKRLSCVA